MCEMPGEGMGLKENLRRADGCVFEFRAYGVLLCGDLRNGSETSEGIHHEECIVYCRSACEKACGESPYSTSSRETMR